MRQPKYTTEKTKKLTEVILPICKNRLKNNEKIQFELMEAKIHKPVLIVIAGPNGSGKTTITNRVLHHE